MATRGGEVVEEGEGSRMVCAAMRGGEMKCGDSVRYDCNRLGGLVRRQSEDQLPRVFLLQA